jgi:hypothetical protein
MMDDLCGVETVIFIRRAYKRLQVLAAVFRKVLEYYSEFTSKYYLCSLLSPS